MEEEAESSDSTRTESIQQRDLVGDRKDGSLKTKRQRTSGSERAGDHIHREDAFHTLFSKMGGPRTNGKAGFSAGSAGIRKFFGKGER